MKQSLIVIASALVLAPEQAAAFKLAGPAPTGQQQLHQTVSKTKVQSQAETLNKMQAKIRDIEKLTDDALKNKEVDEATK